VLYIVAMWISGITQGLMWRTYNDMGNLQYSFIDVLRASHPLYVVRALGGLLFLSGACVMAYNFYKTINDKSANNQLFTKN
jgi:cytochrome c oxidase cbb3-type subunit 1